MASDNRGPELQTVGWVLVSFALVATLLRTYTRIFIVKRFGLDDYCMVFALISFILFVTCALVGVHYGTGRHWLDIEPDDREEAMKYWWLCYLWYCTTMIASKTSIGVFLLRITVRRIDVWIIYSVMVVTILTGIVFFFATLFQCNPVQYFWDKNIVGGHCLDMEVIIALTYLYSAFSVICDFTFALLPLALIWKLNMDKRSKIALVPIMAMACVASAAVVVRFAYVKDFRNPDFLYATVDIAIWSTTEQGLAITAGSLATLRPLLRTVGSWCGLSISGPSELRDTDDNQPPSRGPIKTFGQVSSRQKQRHGSFSLETFARGGEEATDDDHSDNSHQAGVRTYDANDSSIWGLTSPNSRGQNGSEEKLNIHSGVRGARSGADRKEEGSVVVQSVR